MKQLITIIAVSVLSLYLMNAEAQELPENMPAPDTAEPMDPPQDPQGDPVPDDFEPSASTGTNQSNILGANYSGSHVQGGTFVQGNSNHNTRIVNPSQYQGYVAHVPLVASPGTCFGSAGAAISGPGVGLTYNRTKVDQNCNRRNDVIMEQNNMRANAKVLEGFGLQQAAMSHMCRQDDEIRETMRLSLDEKAYMMICGTEEERMAYEMRLSYERELQERDEYEELVAMLTTPEPIRVKAQAPARPAAEFHTVSKGETLWRIAGGTRAGLDRLAKLNPGLSSTIEIGQKIRIN